MLAKFSGKSLKGPYLSLEKDTFCVVLTYSIKQVSEIRKFHVAVVQQQLRNVQKSVMHVQSCFICQSKCIVFFGCLPSLLQKLPTVVIQKFCYRGNMMSHFSSLFSSHPNNSISALATHRGCHPISSSCCVIRKKNHQTNTTAI